jgi:coproporphyrinogen III oxidase-like Fe-S oxidoreductase
MQLGRLLEVCRDSFRITPETEISVEGTPDALTPDKVNSLLDLGVNRLSMGIQRLSDEWLIRMGRGHQVADVLKALETLQGSAVRFNVDLMCGFDDQTVSEFLRDLETVISYDPHEITVYFLEGKFQLSGKDLKGVKPADPFTAYLMWETGRELCQKHGRQEAPMGWWLRPDIPRSKVYVDRWLDQVPLVGFGTGAYSFSRYQQYTNLTGSNHKEALAEQVLPIDKARTFSYSPAQQELHRMAFDLKSVFITQIGVEKTFFKGLEKAGLGKLDDNTFQLNRAGIVVVEEIMRALIEKSSALGQSGGST